MLLQKGKLVSILVLLVLQNAFSQKPDSNFRVNYWDDTLAYQDAQTRYSLDLVDSILMVEKPSRLPSKGRNLAFAILDNVLHQPNVAALKSTQGFYHERISRLINELDLKVEGNQVIVYKLYNHAFIVKTATVSFAFDFTRGYSSNTPDFPISDSLALLLIAKIDVLFISHAHFDHADEWVAEQFIKQNKIVVAPDSVWSNKDFYPSIIHPNRSASKPSKISLWNAREVSFFALPGHQYSTKNKRSVTNNMYLVLDKSGKSILHTGDQYSSEDFKWIDSIKLKTDVDILLPNCWSLELPRLMKSFKPSIVIPGHENELGHTIDHREPYFLNKKRLGKFNSNLVQLTWGEWFFYE